MSKIILRGIILMSVFMLASCEATYVQDIKPTYQRITPAEAKQMMDSLDNYVLLDVRTREEFLEQRIEGAVLIPYDQISAEAESKLPDKNAVILIYCRSGRRSAIAAKELEQMGYTKVFDFGGIIDWPYEKVSGEE